MSVQAGDSESVRLLPRNKTMKQSLDMVLFTIIDYDLVNATVPGKGIRMTITLKRKIMSEMMTTYFPSLLLMMITYATTFFKPFFFEAALSVNLTTMLVMTTIFISKMESLPPTSYIKMIDIWLILCQMVPFAEVILLTAMEYNREDKKKGKKKKSGKKTKKLQNASLTVIRVEEEIVPNEHERGGLCPNCGIPSLKTLGKNQFSQETMYVLELWNRKVGKSLKIGKNRIKSEKSDLISYPTFWQKFQNAIKCQNA